MWNFVDIMWLQSLQSSSNVLIVSVICCVCSCKVQDVVVDNIKIISVLITLQLCNCKVGYVFFLNYVVSFPKISRQFFGYFTK